MRFLPWASAALIVWAGVLGLAVKNVESGLERSRLDGAGPGPADLIRLGPCSAWWSAAAWSA
jgi:hypothetical protein